MATYDLTSVTPSKIETGDILNCPYSGTAKSITLPKGTYKLECWGAQGGYRKTSSYGGFGGYSVGTLTLSDKNIIYIYSGGSGNTGGTSGGFNGGGKRQNYSGGGGASDIRIGTDSLYARVIVAGGGGSDGASTKTGMYGGGTAGGSSTQSYGSGGYGGTQTGVSNSSWQTPSQLTSTTTQAGAYAGFGFGGNGIYYSSGFAGAGGGGWYGGSGSYPDGSGDDDRGGGGGSGYVYTSSTASNYPTGCLLTTDMYLTDTQMIAGNASMPNVSNATETGHSGDGYVRITVIKVNSGNTLIKTDSTTWKNYKNMFIKTPAVLPSGYTQLEYLQSSGTQYIDTGFKPNQDTGVTLEFALMQAASWQCIFGAANSTSNADEYGVWHTGSVFGFYYASSNGTFSGDIGVKHTLVCSKNVATMDGKAAVTMTYGAFTTNYPLLLCAVNYAGDHMYGAQMRLYGAKIYNNNTLVRNLIPAKNSSGTLGMYDTVNSKFYTNAGTGTFIAGPEANPWKQTKGLWVKTDSTTWKQVF